MSEELGENKKLKQEIEVYKRTESFLVRYVNKLHEELGVSFRISTIDKKEELNDRNL